MDQLGEDPPLSPGLYVVSTPIGSARDITLRALDVLRTADVIAAEDTRTARKLMAIHGIALNGRPLLPYHDHNGPRQRPVILAKIREGQSVAYVSDAGTPMVADPGFALVRDAASEGLGVHAVPGASAVLSALVVAGLPTDRFLFVGFLPPQATARARAIAEVSTVPATLVFYEAARRTDQTLAALADGLGPSREAALCRELTKTYEEVRRGTLDDLVKSVAAEPPKGEVVILVDRDRADADPEMMVEMLETALQTKSVKDAARDVSEALGLPRRVVYQTALRLALAEN